ncbi:MAG: hypothetical protein L3J82_06750 [Planctomycetes bacterium]|nr:hypothetical protein [Planctomycetota bacterium]
MRTIIAVFVLLFVSTVNFADGDTEKSETKEYGLAVFKLGEKFATDKKAGKSIDDFCTWLTKSIEGAEFKRRGVRNKPDEFKTLLDKKETSLAIVSPGFYLAHKDELKLEAFAEATRGGLDGEVYSLVGKNNFENYPEATTIATSLSKDLTYLNKVVLPKPSDAKGVVWSHASNTFDACYEIFDEEDGAPDYVLVDQLTLLQIQKDTDLRTLTVVWTGKTLSQDLVVEVDGKLGDKRKNITDVLAKLSDTEAGKRIGKLIQSPKFPAHNETRLKEMETLWVKK